MICHCGLDAPARFHSSCLQRAAWSPAERAAFDADDALDEALELAFPWAPVALAAPDPADRPLRRTRRPDLAGQRFGSLVALRETIIRRGAHYIRGWECRCTCGRTTVVDTYRLTIRGTDRCKGCGARRGHANRWARSACGRQLGGKTIAELARAAGVSPSTISTRIGRGWPLEQVAAPRRREPTKRIAA